jgi:hypothetical protein
MPDDFYAGLKVVKRASTNFELTYFGKDVYIIVAAIMFRSL